MEGRTSRRPDQTIRNVDIGDDEHIPLSLLLGDDAVVSLRRVGRANATSPERSPVFILARSMDACISWIASRFEHERKGETFTSWFAAKLPTSSRARELVLQGPIEDVDDVLNVLRDVVDAQSGWNDCRTLSEPSDIEGTIFEFWTTNIHVD